MLLTLYRIPAEARSRAPILAEQITPQQLRQRGIRVKTLELALADLDAPRRPDVVLAATKRREEEYLQFLRLCRDVEAALALKLARSADKPVRASNTLTWRPVSHDDVQGKCDVVRSAYAWARPQNKYRSRFLPMRWPDLVRDDLAYRKYSRRSS